MSIFRVKQKPFGHQLQKMEAHPKIEIVWNCGDCAKDFATEKLIKAHLRKKHPGYLQEENPFKSDCIWKQIVYT